MQLVVDRVEVALADEIQVLALGVEGWASITQRRPCGEGGLAAFDLDQLDRTGLGGVAEAVGKPAPVERPGHAFDPTELAPVELLHGRRLAAAVYVQQLVTVVRDRDRVLGWRDIQVDDASYVEVGERAGWLGGVRRQKRQHLAWRVTVRGGGDEPLVVVEPGDHAVAHAIRHAVLRNCAFPVVEGEWLASRADRQSAAIRAQRRAVQEALGGHEASLALGARAAEADVESRWAITRWVQQVDIGARVVDEPLATAAEVARVVFVVVGVPLQVIAGRGARVDIAEALVVGQKEDATADP